MEPSKLSCQFVLSFCEVDYSQRTWLCAPLLSCVQLFCHLLDCSPPGSSVHGISQARILEKIAISSSKDLPAPGLEPAAPALADELFTPEPCGKHTATLLNTLLDAASMVMCFAISMKE